MYKKIILSIGIGLLFLHQKAAAQELKSEFLFDLEMEVSSPQMVGPVLNGTRLIFPFKSGQIKGNQIIGKLAEGGGDWGLVLDSTTFKVDARATIKTDDGAIIYLSYAGVEHTNARNFAIISSGRGGELSPSEYYFRTSVTFETSAPKYAWLNRVVGVGVGRFPAAGKVAYKVYVIR